MTDESGGTGTGAAPTFAFWIIAAVALVWNLIGLFTYYTMVSASPETLAQAYTPEQFAVLDATPAWAWAANAVAVTAGVVGSILLLLRMSLAVPLFIISLVALIVQDVYVFGMSDSMAVFGTQPLIIQGIVFLIALFLVGYARTQRIRGVLR